MKFELEDTNLAAWFLTHSGLRYQKPPARVLLRLTAETDNEKKQFRKVFGDFKLDPPEIEFQSDYPLQLIKWDVPKEERPENNRLE